MLRHRNDLAEKRSGKLLAKTSRLAEKGLVPDMESSREM
jgi:hypothetical protein